MVSVGMTDPEQFSAGTRLQLAMTLAMRGEVPSDGSWLDLPNRPTSAPPHLEGFFHAGVPIQDEVGLASDPLQTWLEPPDRVQRPRSAPPYEQDGGIFDPELFADKEGGQEISRHSQVLDPKGRGLFAFQARGLDVLVPTPSTRRIPVSPQQSRGPEGERQSERAARFALQAAMGGAEVSGLGVVPEADRFTPPPKPASNTHVQTPPCYGGQSPPLHAPVGGLHPGLVGDDSVAPLLHPGAVRVHGLIDRSASAPPATDGGGYNSGLHTPDMRGEESLVDYWQREHNVALHPSPDSYRRASPGVGDYLRHPASRERSSEPGASVPGFASVSSFSDGMRHHTPGFVPRSPSPPWDGGPASLAAMANAMQLNQAMLAPGSASAIHPMLLQQQQLVQQHQVQMRAPFQHLHPQVAVPPHLAALGLPGLQLPGAGYPPGALGGPPRPPNPLLNHLVGYPTSCGEAPPVGYPWPFGMPGARAPPPSMGPPLGHPQVQSSLSALSTSATSLGQGLPGQGGACGGRPAPPAHESAAMPPRSNNGVGRPAAEAGRRRPAANGMAPEVPLPPASGGATASNSRDQRPRAAAGAGLKMPQLEELFKSNAYLGAISAIARDQAGCRMLQNKLDQGDPEVVHHIVTEVLNHVADLMMDAFGNYLCQKLFEMCNQRQLEALLERVGPHLVPISLNMHGARSVQKLIDVLQSSPLVPRFVVGLEGAVVPLTKDANGNHVVQRCLEVFPPEAHTFIFRAIANEIVEVASHRNGCRIVQRCIDTARDSNRYLLTGAICEHSLTLVQDPFGNYVVQYVLGLNDPQVNSKVCSCMLGRLNVLSRQKFSSNVVERCLQQCSPEDQARLIVELSDPRGLGELLRDVYGNYVVQSALTVAQEPYLSNFLSAVRPFLPSLRATGQGRRIVQKLEKRYPQLRGNSGGGQEAPQAARGTAPGLVFDQQPVPPRQGGNFGPRGPPGRLPEMAMAPGVLPVTAVLSPGAVAAGPADLNATGAAPSSASRRRGRRQAGQKPDHEDGP